MIRKILLTTSLCLPAFFLIGQVTSYPYTADFELEGQASTTGCPTAYTMLTPGWTNLADQIDWRADVGGTPSTGTGPTVDQNPGTSTGHYLYLESSTCYSQVGALTSPEFDLTAVPNMFLEFWYHMYGISQGTLTVAVTNDAGVTWTDLVTLTDDQDLWQSYMVNLSAYVGDIIQLRFTGVTGLDFYSDMAIDNVNMLSLPDDDIGAFSIDAPTNPLTAGSQFVTASVINYGGNTVTGSDINWSVDGIVQTPNSWSGSITNSQTYGTILLGLYNFPVGSSEVCVWTSLPNGNPDSDTSNDTLCAVLCTGLNGTYTVGGVTPDYLTLTDAVDALTNCGINGPVIFNVAPGVYNEGLVIPPILGASATNTITFDGGDATTTSIVHNGVSPNAVISLEGADYITFTNFTIQNTGTVDAWGVFLTNAANYNTISDCIIDMYYAAAVTDVAGINASADPLDDLTEGNNANYCTFANNTINGGERGITLEGETTFADWMSGITITGNTISGADDYGIYLDNQDSLIIQGNTIDGILNALGDGIYSTDMVNFSITENYIHAPDYGFYIFDGNNPADGPAVGQSKIVNNMVISDTDYGLYLSNNQFVDVWHNTLYNTSGVSSAFYGTNISNLNIRNNIFFSETDYAFETNVNTVTNNNVVNYNSYWTNGTLFIFEAGAQPNLASWQAAQPTQNVNSVQIDPVFVSPTDLHVLSVSLNDLGDNSTGVLVDIDGDSRPLGTNVDMGADEYTPLVNDAVLIDFATPAAFNCGESAFEVSVIVTNYATTITSLPIVVEVTGDVTQTLNFTYTGTILFGEIDTVVVGTINTYNGGNIMLTGYTNYPGDQNTSNDTVYNVAANFIPYEPSGFSMPSCGLDSVMLYADSTNTFGFEWYDAPVGGTLVGSGTTFWIPSVTAQDTYYVQYSVGLAASLSTTYADNNGCTAGAMFDVSSNSSTYLTGFNVHSGTAAGTMVPVTVYYKTGTYVGSEATAGNWTLAGNYVIASGGPGNPSALLSLTSPISVPAGQTVGIYVQYDADYTNGTNVYTDGVLTITAGAGFCGAFDGGIAGRIFNGTVHYGSDPCSDFRTEVVAYVTPEVIVDLGPDKAFCTADMLDAGNPGMDYLWSTGATTQTVTVTTITPYWVEVTDADNCQGFDTIQVMAIYPPTPVSLGADTIACDQNGEVALSPGGGYQTWTWSPSGNTGQTEFVSTSGDYIVTVSDIFGCTNSDTINVTFMSCLGVDDLNSGISEFAIYPNPSNGNFNIRIALKDGVTLMSTEVLSLDGKQIFVSSDQNSSPEIIRAIDITDQADGVYILRIVTSSGMVTARLIVE